MDDKHELSFYEKLFMLGHDIELTRTVDGDADPDDLSIPGFVTQRIVTKEPTLAMAYHMLINMRGALIECRGQFLRYSNEYQSQLDSAHLTMVERQGLEYKRDRDLGIAEALNSLTQETPSAPDTEWQDIVTAPQDGSMIRLLGRLEHGPCYVETGRWENIQWSVVARRGYLPPTHWKPMDRLPQGYLDAHP